MLSLK
jgi:hypothetical protein